MLVNTTAQFVLLCAKLVKMHHSGWGLCCTLMIFQLKLLATLNDEKTYTLIFMTFGNLTG
jgi:hypothetical protein